MSDMQLLIDFFAPLSRLGPGSPALTMKALEASGCLGRPHLRVADVGCGTGASALVLAAALDGQITAVDLLPELLAGLSKRASAAGLHNITPLQASMDALPLAPGSLDLIWCEAAIYSMGFDAGVRAFRSLLAPGGVLAVSEVVWLTARRPAELEAFWAAEYAEMGSVEDKRQVLERAGYTIAETVLLPPSAWLEDYYGPVRARCASFLDEQGHTPEAEALVAAMQHESDLYERFSEHVGYMFFIARPREAGAARP